VGSAIIEMSVVLITGANRGIGFAIAQLIGTRLPSSTVLIGCRSKAAGEDAVSRLKGVGLQCQLDVVEIDIENDASIRSAAEVVQNKYGRLDGKARPT